MLKGVEITKSIKEITSLFTWNKISGGYYFDLVAETSTAGESYYKTLKANLAAHQLPTNLFTWDLQSLTIRITKKNFIHWQRVVQARELEQFKNIMTQRRLFFRCKDSFFTILLRQENGVKLKKTLMTNARKRRLNVKFEHNVKEKIIEISEQDYLQFTSVPFKKVKRKFENDDVSKCYFTSLKKRETLKNVLKELNSLVSKQAEEIFIVNTKLSRIEIKQENFHLIEKLVKRTPSFKIRPHLKKFHEGKDCFYIKPEEGETLENLCVSMQTYFNQKYVYNKIKFKIDYKNNYVYISKEDHQEWQEKGAAAGRRSILEKDFIFDPQRDCYLAKFENDDEMYAKQTSIQRRCRTISLPYDVFNFKRKNNEIEITKANYQRYIETELEMKAKKYAAYSVGLTKDEKTGVYFYHSKDCPADNITRGFNDLAKLLSIDVKFLMRHSRTEIDAQGYQRWIAHPIIQQSLATPREYTLTRKRTVKAKGKTTAVTRISTKQTIQNTKGGVSAKYLENAIVVPLTVQSKTTEEKKSSLLSKGHVISFDPIESVFSSKDAKRYHKSFTLDFEGIKAEVTLYSSEKTAIQDVFSRNVVFVRAGRKENALLPALKNSSNSVIVVIMTAQECQEAEKALGFLLSKRLPSQIKLCVVNSCSIEKQPLSEPESYVRTSNIKRVVAYALAHKYSLPHFILMDDNSTQIQIAEKMAQRPTVDALFELFAQYKKNGTVCATLGSFAPFKPIKAPLEATRIEPITEKLGSKIMYVDYQALRHKLASQKIQLHEILSPCSLWWGEDYFNMLGILQSVQSEERAALVGVLPYSVAWHIRSQKQVNKTKTNHDFKLANIWLNIDTKFLNDLTPHQRLVIEKLQCVVISAIEHQKKKEQRYLDQLEQLTKPEENIEELSKVDEDATSSAIALGRKHGIQAAKRGYELNVEKLKLSVTKSNETKFAQEYIEEFTKAHVATWGSLSDDAKAFGRGFQEGYLAAKQGLNEKSCQHVIPSLFKEQSLIYKQGFIKGNQLQWQKMRDSQDPKEVEAIAKRMGVSRAKQSIDINEDKLKAFAVEFGQNAPHFENCFREAFKAAKDSLTDKEIVMKKAVMVAQSLSQQTAKLDMAKLNNKSTTFGVYSALYQSTVVKEFHQLQKRKELRSTGQSVNQSRSSFGV